MSVLRYAGHVQFRRCRHRCYMGMLALHRGCQCNKARKMVSEKTMKEKELAMVAPFLLLLMELVGGSAGVPV